MIGVAVSSHRDRTLEIGVTRTLRENERACRIQRVQGIEEHLFFVQCLHIDGRIRGHAFNAQHER
jgi:hypothetical protein